MAFPFYLRTSVRNFNECAASCNKTDAKLIQAVNKRVWCICVLSLSFLVQRKKYSETTISITFGYGIPMSHYIWFSGCRWRVPWSVKLMLYRQAFPVDLDNLMICLHWDSCFPHLWYSYFQFLQYVSPRFAICHSKHTRR